MNELPKLAYERYGESIGLHMIPWESLSTHAKVAWTKAISAVVERILEDQSSRLRDLSDEDKQC